jgi:hypothetical protein
MDDFESAENTRALTDPTHGIDGRNGGQQFAGESSVPAMRTQSRMGRTSIGVSVSVSSDAWVCETQARVVLRAVRSRTSLACTADAVNRLAANAEMPWVFMTLKPLNDKAGKLLLAGFDSGASHGNDSSCLCCP